MKRKNWIIGIAAVLLTVFAFKGIAHYRWSKLSAEEKAGTITGKMAEYFDLSADQQAKVYALNLEKMQTLESARHSGPHNRAEWKALRESWHQEFREILTPEQQKRFH